MKSRVRRDFSVLSHLEKWSDFQAAGLRKESVATAINITAATDPFTISLSTHTTCSTTKLSSTSSHFVY